MGARAARRKADDKWVVRVNHKGHRRTKVFGRGPVARDAAKEAAKQIEAKLVLGDLGVLERDDALPTLRAQSEAWLRDYAAVYCQGSTQRNYALAFRDQWLPDLGSLLLKNVTRDTINATIGRLLRAGLKPSSIKSALIPLRACLHAAIEAGHLAKDPTKGIGKLLARQAPSEEVDPRELFTAAELERIIGTARVELPEQYPAVLTLARTMARIGEVLTLQVDDLDFARGTVSIRRTLTRSRGQADVVSHKPKGRKYRVVEMSPQLTEALRAQDSLIRAEAALRGVEATWLFPGADITRPRPHTSGWRRDVWRALLRRAGIRYRHPHTVRHTVASMLVESGVSLAYVSKVLGHHSPAFTAKVYVQVLPDGNRGAMTRLDSAPTVTECNSAATTARASVPVS